MLKQESLIQAVQEKGKADARIDGIWMYGSFTQGEGDAYSDVEFYIFVQDDTFAALDTAAWIAEVYPVYTTFFNDFGTQVAIFQNMVRGEFHFHTASEMAMIDGFRGAIDQPDIDAMCLYDKAGTLHVHLQSLVGADPLSMGENAQHAADNMINNLLFGWSVFMRGEIARSHELLWYVQRYYLQLVRIAQSSTAHWLNPTRWLEREIPAEYYDAYAGCTAPLQKQAIRQAYTTALDNLKSIFAQLTAQGVLLKDYAVLFTELEKYMA